MKIHINPTKVEAGHAAAKKAAGIFRKILHSKAKACFIAATGASQFDFLDYLCKFKGIDWVRTEMFHLDEYIGLTRDHPASFRKYLSERLVERVHPGQVHFIEGDASDPELECKRLGDLISKEKIDIAFIGIGENGHIAFNDPPADFETEDPYIIVNLDDKCRRQQIGEGWFKSLEEVPHRAISLSVRQLMKSDFIICTCPEKRKAEAVRDCLSKDSPVSPMHPASILKQHKKTYIFLDKESASFLKR